MNFQLKTEMIRALRVLRMASISRCFGGGRRAGLALASAVLLTTWSEEAAAYNSCTGTSETLTLNMPLTVTIPRDATVGALLTNWVTAGRSNFFVCTPSPGYTTADTSGSLTNPVGFVDSGIKVTHTGTGVSVTVWKSNVAGVGIAVLSTTFLNGNAQKSFSVAPLDPSSNYLFGQHNPDPMIWGGQVQVALVKTDVIASTGGTVAAGVRVQQQSFLASGTKSFNMTATTVTPQTCLVTTGNIAVSMGNIKPASLASVGATSPATAFNIGVNCAGVASKVYMTLTDQQTPGNVSKTLPLTTTSTAAGVGIQILFNNNPMAFGPDSSVAGNAGQFAVFTSDGSAGASVTTVAFAARYIRTGTITPGTANGLATFTMSYQ